MFRTELKSAVDGDADAVRALSRKKSRFDSPTILEPAEITRALEPIKIRYNFRAHDKRMARLARVALARLLGSSNPRLVIQAATAILDRESSGKAKKKTTKKLLAGFGEFGPLKNEE